MTYVVSKASINCRYQDCIDVCPVEVIKPATIPDAHKCAAKLDKLALLCETLAA